LVGGTETPSHDAAGERGEKARESKDNDLDALDGQTRKACGFEVAADGVHGPSQHGALQDEPADKTCDDHHDNGNRDTGNGRAQPVHRRRGADGGAIGDDQSRTAGNGHHGQCGNKRGNLAISGGDTTDGTGQQTREQTGNQRQPARHIDIRKEGRGDHRSQRSNGADRKVNAGGDDDKGHAKRQDSYGGGLDADIEEVIDGQKVRRGNKQRDAQDDERNESTVVHYPCKELILLLFGFGRRSGRRVEGGGHWESSLRVEKAASWS